MNNKLDIAVAKFQEGFNCSQAVMYSFSDELQIEKEIALKLACGFGAGMGRKEEVCGAVTGGIIVIGCKYGRGEKDDPAATELTYRARKIVCVNGKIGKTQTKGETDRHHRRTARHFDEELQEARRFDWRERASEATNQETVRAGNASRAD